MRFNHSAALSSSDRNQDLQLLLDTDRGDSSKYIEINEDCVFLGTDFGDSCKYLEHEDCVLLVDEPTASPKSTSCLGGGLPLASPKSISCLGDGQNVFSGTDLGGSTISGK